MKCWLCWIALFAGQFGAANAQDAVSPESYGELPTVAEAAISPDGRTLARIQNINGVNAIAFIDLAGEKPSVGMELANAKARTLRWAGPEHAMLLVSGSTTVSWGHGLETHEVWRWYSIDREAKHAAIPFRGYTNGRYYSGAGVLKAMNPAVPDQVVFGHGIPYSLYEVNLNSGAEKLIERGESETDDWVVDAAGAPTIRIDYDSGSQERRFYLRGEGAQRFKLASSLPEKREDSPIFEAATAGDASNLAVGIAPHEGYKALRVFDASTGSFTGSAVTAPGYDVSEAIVDPNVGKVVGIEYTDDFRRVRFFDERLAAAQAKVERAMPNAAPIITSWSQDFKKFVVRVAYADHPDQVFLFEPDAKLLAMHSPTYASIDGVVFAHKEKFDYPSPDGLMIHGYLTVPKGASKKRMPLIVLPHGGPWARDDQSFDWWSYFYAANGYLVYQPNFRGSSGYGKAFEEAGFLQWGRKMQDDVTDGVKKLVADGIADPARICIVGGSYGGYSALVGATLTPDLYACAVSVAGVSNIPAMIAYQTDRGRVPEDGWDVRIGARVSDNAALREISPYYQASRARSPILLIHGDKDIVVPIDQSLMMKTAIDNAGADATLLILKDEDHWLSSSTTRTEMLAASLDFINRQIGD